MSDWISRLRDSIANQADKIPPGWWTVKEEAKRLKMTERTTCKNVSMALSEGILERRVFRVMGRKSIIKIAHYREKK